MNSSRCTLLHVFLVPNYCALEKKKGGGDREGYPFGSISIFFIVTCKYRGKAKVKVKK